MENVIKKQITSDDVLIQQIHNQQLQYLENEPRENIKPFKYCKVCDEREVKINGFCEECYKEEHSFCNSCKKKNCECDYYDND